MPPTYRAKPINKSVLEVDSVYVSDEVEPENDLLSFSTSANYQDLSKTLQLKSDHEKRPIWITEDNIIILEAFSKYYNQAYDFLIDIAEPIARPIFFQTYRLTEDSLYSAVAISHTTESIIKYLNILCKTNVPEIVQTFIKKSTNTFGKAKLVLKNNIFYVESQYPDVLRELLRNPYIQDSRILDETIINNNNDNVTKSTSVGSNTNKADLKFLETTTPLESSKNKNSMNLIDLIDKDDGNNNNNNNNNIDTDDDYNDSMQELLLNTTTNNNNTMGNMNNNNIILPTMKTVSFMIAQDRVQIVKKCAKEQSKYPLMEEYDFRADTFNPPLPIDLRPSTTIRPYQERSLSKMFGNGRARSGIIVLPCGAGKSLTGVTAVSTIKKSTIILCINNASVKQWKEQFLLWSSVAEKSLKMFTSGSKELLTNTNIKDPLIVMTTYSMICHSGKRSESASYIMKILTSREWGLMILDEVHVAPADMFQKVLQIVNAHCKLGLTATLVREDNKIKDLSFLVGPKLYEANWIDLTNSGYLARAQCVEVWCPMTKEFYNEYIRCGITYHTRTQKLLYLINPNKFRICEYLISYHLARNDKIILFSDDLPALYLYCSLLKPICIIPYICGETKEEDRRKYLFTFKTTNSMNCIGLSAVGDTALDIPEANVVIQISSHFGARRQEAQRLGRILRPKQNSTGGYNAFFYTLVSTDTKESYFSSKRQQYLIDQGYTFKIIQDLSIIANKNTKIINTVSQELQLLQTALTFRCEAYDNTEKVAITKLQYGETENDDIIPSSTSNTGSSAADKKSKKINKNIETNTISNNNNTSTAVKRKVSTLGSLSGGGSDIQYTEYSTMK